MAAFIEVTPADATIPLAGDSIQLRATLRDARGRQLKNGVVFWESMAPTIAMVTANGTVIGLDKGKALIRGLHKTLSATAVVTVAATPFPSPPVRLQIEPQTDTISAVGNAVQLRVDAYDDSGNVIPNAQATWFSLDGQVADVSGGRVSGRRKGVARILVTNGKVADTAFVYVAPTVPVVAIRLEPSVDTIFEIGDVLPLQAVALDANGNPIPGETMTMSSLDASVATIDGQAVVTASAAGDARITANYGKKSDTSYISVVPVAKAASMTISPAVDTIPTVGGSVVLTARVTDSSGAELSVDRVRWSSLDPQALLTGPGVVAGVRSGVARIVAKYGSKADTALVWVAPAPPAAQPAAVVVTPKTDTIDVGAQAQLVATVVDAQGSPISGKTVTWTTADESVATVDALGKVLGVAPGRTTVTAANGTLSGKAELWVVATIKPMDVEVNPVQDTIAQIGGTVTLAVEVIGSNGFVIADEGATWQSLNPDIASVTGSGTQSKYTIVTGSGRGTARIVATNGTLKDTALVAIAPAEGMTSPADVRVTPAMDTVAVGSSVKLTGVVVDASGLTLSSFTVVWAALDPAIATVDGIGNVKGLSTGWARVRASYGTLADTARIYVPVPGTTPTAVEVTPARDTIPAVGGSIELAAVVKDAAGNVVPNATVTWSSLDGAIAAVNSSGVVTGKGTGTARITAASGSPVDTAWVAVAPSSGGAVSWTLNHSPANPSTSSAVTITASASDPTAIASTSLKVDGNVVKTCTGGWCSHAGLYADGVHSYSATAVTAGGSSVSAGSGSFTVTAAWSGTGPSPTSPHWRHMRTSVIDYRIHYLKEPQRSAEYDWAASHYDHVTGGLALLDDYRVRNPTISHATYDKFWFTPVADSDIMDGWLAARGYPIENAYLHKPGMPKEKANRILEQQFAGRDYWYLNLGDPGFRAWREQRTKNFVAGGTSTIFYDSNSPTTVRKYVPSATLEYASYTEYFADYNDMLKRQRALLPAGYLMPNHAQNFSRAEELAVTRDVTGGVMVEYENTPYGSGVKEWNAIDGLVAAGAVVQFATGVSPGSKNDPRGDMNPGNYNSIAERVLMWEYVSYLMVADPARMDAVFFESYGLNWSNPFSVTWLKAFERDIGLATGRRSVLTSGTDGAGQGYSVYKREFDNNAMVLIRPQGGTTYGDVTGVNVTLPGGTWRMVRADGSLSGGITSVRLRNSEAVVLIR